MSAASLPFKQVCVVSGGNAAHALAALLPSRGIKTVWYAPYADEAERILKAGGTIEADFAAHNNPSGLVTGKPEIISANAADVIPDSDVLLMPLPSFAYPATLKSIKYHLKPGTCIFVTPGQGGFDWTAREILGKELCETISFCALLPMPFNCRISEFGKKVHVQTLKTHYRVGAVPESSTPKAVEINKALFGAETESVGHFLNATLYPVNAIIHPQRLYALCKDWKPDGPPLPENPLFYESMDKASTDLMDKVNQELISVGKALKEQGMSSINVPHIYDFLTWVYSDVPVSNMIELFAKNDAYKGFRCPFTEVEGGWVPNFQNRYFTEDIPMGLCIYKGVADIAGVATPTMDMVLEWAQTNMGKEYLKDGKLQGKDVGETTAPQRFGLKTVEDLTRGGPE